ncbi:MAG: ester cyclase [Pseudomonadota bacterium]
MGAAADVVREACRVIWTEGQVDRVPEFYAADFRADYPMTDWGTGLPGVAALAESVRREMPDYAEQIEELVEAGEEVVVRLTITGTHRQTGTRVSFRDVTMLTVRDGRICFQRGLTDYLSLYAQLGLVELPGRASA